MGDNSIFPFSDQVFTILKELKSTNGNVFFDQIIGHFHDISGADFTYIGSVDHIKNTVTTITGLAGRDKMENFSYSLKDTPCNVVKYNETCFYPANVCQFYPDDKLLIDMGIEAYVGTPLIDSESNVIGIIVALFKFKENHVQHIAELFDLFSGRIAVELEKINKAEELILKKKEKADQEHYFKNITDKLPGMVVQYYINPDGTDGIKYLSTGVEDLYGLDHEKASNDVDLIWKQVVSEDVPDITNSLKESAAYMTDWECTFRIHDTKGNLKYVRTVGSPEKDESGRIVWDTIALDVTKEMLLNNAIKSQQKQLENVNDKIPVVVLQYFVDKDGKDGLTYLSDGVKKVYGIEQKDAFENVGLIWDRVLPEYLPGLKDSLQRSAVTLEDWDYIWEAKDINGNHKFIRGMGTPHKTEDEKIVWDTITLDITKQVEQEREIWDKNNQLQNFTDQLAGIAMRYYLKSDGTDGLMYLSKGVEELYEIDRDKALHDVSLMWKQIHPDDLQDVSESVQYSAKHLSKWENIHRIITPSGSIKYLSSIGIPHKQKDGTIIWDTISMDITERKKAELEANKSSSKLRAFIKSSPIAIYQIDPNGTVTDFWNSAAEQIYGWTKEEVLNNTIPTVTDDSKEEFLEIIEDIRITHKPKQFQVNRKNRYNEDLILEITAGPLFDENDKLTDLLIIANDITELEEYRKTLESALREKEILLQEIHHRVKNNLAIVSGLLELQALKDDNEHDMSLIIEARNRIHSIAMVHEQLYQDMDFSHINPKEYYQKLLKKLQ